MAVEELLKTDYVTVDKSDSISQLVGHLKSTKESNAVIFDKGKYAGMTDTHLLLREKVNPTTTKVAKVLKKVPALTGEESTEEIARLMLTSNMRVLPVIKNNHVVGVVKAKDLIKRLGSEFGKKKVKEVMSAEPLSINEDEGIGKAMLMMRKENVSRLPIVDDKGELVKIITLSDVLSDIILTQQKRSASHGRSALAREGSRAVKPFKDKPGSGDLAVKNVSPAVTVTAAPEDSVERTIDKLDRFNISSVIVVEGKKPVGILATRDLLKLFLKGKENY